MNPQELQQQIELLQNQVNDLRLVIEDLQRPNLITPEFKQVLDRTVVASSGKTLASETQAVNEAGSGTYNVPTIGNGFISIGGYNLMYWT